MIKNVIEVTTNVEYEIYEVGNFHNVEKLLININKGQLTLNRWEDIRVKSMELGAYDGLDMMLCHQNDDETHEEVGYWRKANAIHGWFVRNVQNGKDDCGTN